MKKINLILLLFLVLSNFNSYAKNKKWMLSAGAYIIGDFEADITANGSSGTFAGVDLPALFGMKTDAFSAYLDGHFRISPEHRLEFGYKYTDSDGGTTYNGTIFDGTPIETTITGNVESSLEVNTLKFLYGYSLVNNEEIELTLNVGLHRVAIDFKLFDDGQLDVNSSFEFHQPLPVLGARVRYNFNPKLSATFSYDIFSLFDGVQVEHNSGLQGFEGTLSDATISFDYLLKDFFSLGLGLNFLTYDFTLDLDKSYDLNIEYEVTGIILKTNFFF